MRLTVLGGSAAGPNPGAGCSGYLIQDRDTAIVVDLGPGTIPELKKHIDPRSLAAIVISHAHLDHILDLGTLRYSLKYSPSPARQPIPVWLPPGGRETLYFLARAFSSELEAKSFYTGIFEFREFDPARQRTIESLRLAFAPGVHYVPSWAIRVDGNDGRSVGYTADTGPAAHLSSLFEKVDLLVAEATLLEPGPEPESTRGHLTAGEAGKLASSAGATVLLLSHIWDELGVDRLWQQASAAFGGRIEVARPGLMLNV